MLLFSDIINVRLQVVENYFLDYDCGILSGGRKQRIICHL